jgi:hypothetical protein
MGCRAIRLAALSVIFALSASATVSAQNLDAGKTPQQIFSSTCTACHSSPRGLLKSVGAGQLPGFLRQHYTTGSEMAGTLAAYLMQNGAAQHVEAPVKGAKGKKSPDDTTPTAAAKSKEPPATADEPADSSAPAASTKKQALSKKKKGDKRAPQETASPAASPAQPAAVATPESKPAEAKPAETAPAAAAVEIAPHVNAEGLPDPPEPPPLSPDLLHPAAPTELPPPQPPY